MDYQLLDTLIQEKQQSFYQVSDQIWGFAEMRYQEFQSAKLQKDVLKREGFTIEENLGGHSHCVPGQIWSRSTCGGLFR